MTDLATGALIALAVALAGWALYYVVRDRALDNPLFYGLAALEVLLLVQLLAGLVALAGTERDIDTPTFVGYLLTTVLVLPLAVFWAVSEKTRWGMAVVLVGCLTVAALVLRSHQVWTAPGA